MTMALCFQTQWPPLSSQDIAWWRVAEQRELNWGDYVLHMWGTVMLMYKWLDMVVELWHSQLNVWIPASEVRR